MPEKDGIKFDPNYSTSFIPEHCIETAKWPKGITFGAQSGNKQNNAIKKIYVHTDGVTYRLDSISLAVERFGSWVRKKLEGSQKNTDEKWVSLDLPNVEE